jgi:hypothetical protein
MKLVGRSFFLLILVGCISCDYRWDLDYPGHRKPTFYILPIEGDYDGELSKVLGEAIESSGLAFTTSYKGDYELALKLLDSRFEPIGFKRDQLAIKEESKLNLSANEERLIVSFSLSLIGANLQNLGPFYFSCYSDYDFVEADSLDDLTFIDSSGNRKNVLTLSLGQLDSLESARESAWNSVCYQVAQKVVDVISSTW